MRNSSQTQLFAKVSHGDKWTLASELRDIFRTGQCGYTIEMAWKKWQNMRERRGKDYRAFKLMCNNADYKAFDRMLSNITCDKTLFLD